MPLLPAGPPEILTIYDRKSSTLLDVREMDDYDDDEISLRTSLLARCVLPRHRMWCEHSN